VIDLAVACTRTLYVDADNTVITRRNTRLAVADAGASLQ